MTCPTSQQLKAFLDGRLAETEFEYAAEHLESCTHCAEALDTLYLEESREMEETLDEQIRHEFPGGSSWGESLGARQLTQRLLDPQSIPDDQLGPDSVGGMKIVRYLASGSFGRVFLGWDGELERHVAVKLPRTDLLIDNHLIEEFQREAQLAAKLEHPGIVPIYDFGKDEDIGMFFISGYIDGCNLREWRELQKPSFDDSIRMVIKIATIIDFAHQHQLVHRDLKPNNILIDKDGNPHLVDFGLSSIVELNDEQSSQSIVGSPAYLPPEYLEHDHSPTDPRGDLYSLGVVLYELLTGSCPYNLKPDSWKLTLQNEDPVNPRTRNSRISQKLESLCLKGIHRDPQKRYQNAKGLINELEDYLHRSPLSISSGE